MGNSDFQKRIDEINPVVEGIMDQLAVAYIGEPVKNKGYLVIHNANKILELDLAFDYVFSRKREGILIHKIDANSQAAKPEEIGPLPVSFKSSIPFQEWLNVKYDYDDNKWRINSISPSRSYEPRTTWGAVFLSDSSYYVTNDPPHHNDAIPEDGKGHGLGSGIRIWAGSDDVELTYLNKEDLNQDWVKKMGDYASLIVK